MAYSTWGGVGAFVEEGVKRYQAEQKKKEEEERQSRQEEARRQASILIPSISNPNPTRTYGPRTNPALDNIVKPQQSSAPTYRPSANLENPFKVSTDTPQISYSAPREEEASQTVTAPKFGPVMQQQQPTIGPQFQTPSLFKGLAAWNNMQNPKAQTVPVGTIASPIPSMIGDAAKPYLDQFGQFVQQGVDALKNIPDLGIERAVGSMLPHIDNMPEGLRGPNEQAGTELGPRTEGSTSAMGQVIERYKYNLIEKPQDATDQLLLKFAPSIYYALKVGTVLGAGSELALAAPQGGILLGQPGKTLGEAWATGVRAQQIYNLQTDAHMQAIGAAADPQWAKDRQAKTGVALPTFAPRASIVASLGLANDEYYAAIAPTGIIQQTADPAQILYAIEGAKSMAWHGIASAGQQFDDLLNYPAQATQLRDQAKEAYQQAAQEPDPAKREQLLFQAAALGAQAKQLANTHPSQLFDKNANWWSAIPAEMIFDPTMLLDAGMKIFELAPKARRLVQGAKLADMTVEGALDAMRTGKGVASTVEQSIVDNLKIGKWTFQNPNSLAGVEARNNWRALSSLVKGFTTKEDFLKITMAYVTDAEKMLREGIPASELTSPIVKLAFPEAQATAPTAGIGDAIRSGVGQAWQSWMSNPASAMDPTGVSEWTGLVSNISNDVLNKFQVHGTDTEGIVNILENGIDPARTFHSGPPLSAGYGVASTRTENPFLVLSDPNQAITQVKNLVVNGYAAPLVDQLKAILPNINVMGVQEAAEWMMNPVVRSDAQNMATWGAAIFGNYDAIKSLPSLEHIKDLIPAMPSLQGTGPVHIGDFATDLYTLLLRGAGERFGVATMAGAPAGARTATTVMGTLADTAKVQYFGQGRKMLYETAEMGLGEANKMVKEFSSAIKKGSELTSGWIETAGNAQRSVLSLIALDSSFKAAINNFFSNRSIASLDGVWSFKGYDHAINFLEGINNGVIPFDQIASAVNDLKVNGGSRSMFSEGLSNLPIIKQIREIRLMDEQNSKVIVFAKTVEDYLHGKGLTQFKPAMESFLRESGWTDPEAIRHAVASTWDSAMRGGAPALMKSIYDIANGSQPSSAAVVAPHFREIFGGLSDQVDAIVKGVTPDTLAQGLAEVDRLRGEALSNLSNLTNDYVFAPGRTRYTRLEEQKGIVSLQNRLRTVADKLGEDYATGVQPYLEAIINGQRDVNKNVMQLVQMANGEPKNAGHIYDLWESLSNLRETTNTNLTRIADSLFSGGGIPQEVQQFATGAVFDEKEAMKIYRSAQEEYHRALNVDSNNLISTARNAIASGADYVGNHPAIKVLEQMAHDPMAVFDYNKVTPGRFISDPNRQAAIKAGQAGLQKFTTQMLSLFQANPSESGFDHFLSTMDDIAEYMRTNTGPGLDALRHMQDEARDLSNAADRLVTGVGKNAAIKKASKAWDNVWKLNTELWVEHYEFAYNRMQAGSALIAQAANGVSGLPRFTPLDHWGEAIFGQAPGNVVELMGRNIRNAKEFLIKTPQGKTMAIPLRAIPPEAIAAWDEMSKNLYQQLAGQVGKFGIRAFTEGTGVAEIDGLINKIRTATKNPVFDAVREDIARYAQNPMAYGDMGADLTTWYGKQINSIADSIKAGLPGYAARNISKAPVMPMDRVGVGANQLKPLWDNIMAGANKAAEEMVKFSLIDFANKYGGDSVSGLFVPYAYWASRQGKNMVERMLFNPLLFNYLAKIMRVNESVNRANSEPQRYNDSIMTGIDIPKVELPFGYEVGGGELAIPNVLPRWAPFGLEYIFSGWGDIDKASQGAETLLNNFETNGFPDWTGIAGAFMAGSEIAGALGASQYPWQRDAILAANGRGGEINLSSNLGPLGEVIGKISGALSGGYTPFVQDYYQPYTVSRDIANQGFGVDDEGKNLMGAGQAQYEGRNMLPEFARDHPEAQADWQQTYKNQTLEELIFALIGDVTGVRMSLRDPKEIERSKAQKTYTNMGWDPDGNPTGSRERTQMLDPNSPNYVPGLATGQSAYQVINEGPQREDVKPAPPAWPFMPTYETRDIDQGVSLGDYLGKLNAIEDKYKAADAAMIVAHPEWQGDLVSPDRSDWTNQQFEAQQAEKDALDLEYPDIADHYADKTPASLRGANPLETTREAMARLFRQATEANKALKPTTDFPKEGSNSEQAVWVTQNDAYKAARDKTFQELLSDPQKISDSVFNRPLDTSGPMPGQPSPRVGPALAPSGTGPAVVGQPQAGQASTSMVAPSIDPNNPYSADMTAAEKANGLPAGLLAAVMSNESGGTVDALSPAGAQGLMQIMPKTWDEWAPKVGATDPNNPQDSIKVAAAYLAWLQGQLPEGSQDTVGLMTAYNWGIGNLKSGKTPPSETTAYANRIADAVNQPVGVPGNAQFISPLPEGTRVSQGYGANVSDYSAWNGDHGHEGIDYGVPVGTPVGAAAGGTVEFAGTGAGFGNYGNYIVIDHGNGYKSYYAHLSEFDVEVGDTVSQGDIIALSGNSGHSTGAHLHFSIRKDGDTSGPYGMVDPTGLLGQPAMQIASLSPGQVEPAIQTASIAPDVSPLAPTVKALARTAEFPAPAAQVQEGVQKQVQATATKSGPVNLPMSADQFVQQQSDKYKAPERIALDASVDDAWLRAYDRIAKTYPDSAKLFDEYKAINDEDRKAWRAAHPMIKALNFLVYDENEFAYLEKTYGKGIIQKWAAIPPYTGEGDDAASKYYHANPEVFVAKAWIVGRPEIYDESAFVPDKEFSYNLGKDFEEAKSLFGDNIWDVVQEYYRTPTYVKGEANTEWIAFKRANPQFDDWRVWWYEKLGGQTAAKPFFGYGSGSYNGYHKHGTSSAGKPQWINPVEFQRQAPPRFEPGGTSGDWRKYFNTKNPNK